MKVDNSISQLGQAPAGPKAARSTPTPSSSQPATGAKVQISALSAQLQGAEAVAADASVVDVKRVAEIKQAIAEGRFKIDPEKIADGLLDSVRQMLNGRAPAGTT